MPSKIYSSIDPKIKKIQFHLVTGCLQCRKSPYPHVFFGTHLIHHEATQRCWFFNVEANNIFKFYLPGQNLFKKLPIQDLTDQYFWVNYVDRPGYNSLLINTIPWFTINPVNSAFEYTFTRSKSIFQCYDLPLNYLGYYIDPNLFFSKNVVDSMRTIGIVNHFIPGCDEFFSVPVNFFWNIYERFYFVFLSNSFIFDNNIIISISFIFIICFSWLFIISFIFFLYYKFFIYFFKFIYNIFLLVNFRYLHVKNKRKTLEYNVYFSGTFSLHIVKIITYIFHIKALKKRSSSIGLEPGIDRLVIGHNYATSKWYYILILWIYFHRINYYLVYSFLYFFYLLFFKYIFTKCIKFSYFWITCQLFIKYYLYLFYIVINLLFTPNLFNKIFSLGIIWFNYYLIWFFLNVNFAFIRIINDYSTSGYFFYDNTTYKKYPLSHPWFFFSLANNLDIYPRYNNYKIKYKINLLSYLLLLFYKLFYKFFYIIFKFLSLSFYNYGLLFFYFFTKIKFTFFKKILYFTKSKYIYIYILLFFFTIFLLKFIFILLFILISLFFISFNFKINFNVYFKNTIYFFYCVFGLFIDWFFTSIIFVVQLLYLQYIFYELINIIYFL